MQLDFLEFLFDFSGRDVRIVIEKGGNENIKQKGVGP